MSGVLSAEVIQSLLELAAAGDLTSESLNDVIESSEATSKGFDTLINTTTKVAGSLNSFVGQVSTGTGAINSMGGAVSGITEALGDAIPFIGGLVKGAGKVLSFAIDRMQASFSSFQQIADIGAIGAEGISGLRKQFDEAKIPLEMYTSMLKNNAKDLTFIYGTSLTGSKKFAESMATMNKESNMSLRYMGFTVEEVGDTMVNFQKMNSRLGFQQIMDQQKLANATTNYGKELDILSKLTGESKKTLQADRDSRMLDARYRAVLLGMNKDEAEATRKFMALQKSLGPEIEKQAMAALTGFVSSADGIKGELSGVGPIVRSFRESIRQGDYSVKSMVKHTKSIGEATGEFAKSQKSYFLARGDDDGIFTALAVSLDAQVRAGKLSVEEAEKMLAAQEKQIAGYDASTKLVVDSNQLLLESAVNLDMLASSGGFAASVIHLFSETLAQSTNKLRELIGNISSQNGSTPTSGGFTNLTDQNKDAIKSKNNDIVDLKKQLKQAEIDFDVDEVEKLSKKIKDKESDIVILNARKKWLGDLKETDYRKKLMRQAEISNKRKQINAEKSNLNSLLQENRTAKSKITNKKNISDESRKKLNDSRVSIFKPKIEASKLKIGNESKVLTDLVNNQKELLNKPDSKNTVSEAELISKLKDSFKMFQNENKSELGKQWDPSKTAKESMGKAQEILKLFIKDKIIVKAKDTDSQIEKIYKPKDKNSIEQNKELSDRQDAFMQSLENFNNNIDDRLKDNNFKEYFEKSEKILTRMADLIAKQNGYIEDQNGSLSKIEKQGGY